jgi:(E)-4-hydroxy-3-methylbut-2-enyl-diphosphate synthase
VVDFVDKVRINPGNFVDKRASFKQMSYDDSSYAKEIEKIEQTFAPLVEKCKRLKKSMRIGTNHGSLSDRIMNRYGDTPAGMVESALEFARIARSMDYHELIFSMKASNPQVMVQAYRLLAAEMYTLGWDYPFHLGVTEAGEGEDGRVKSAMGIGTLLLDGLGDTIRVSLTEDPWYEIDPCRRLVNIAAKKEGKGVTPFKESYRTIQEKTKRVIQFSPKIPMHKNGTVFLSLSESEKNEPLVLKSLGCDGSFGLPKLKSMTVDNIVFNQPTVGLESLRDIGIGFFNLSGTDENFHPILSLKNALEKQKTEQFSPIPFPRFFDQVIEINEEEEWDLLIAVKPSLIIFSPKKHKIHASRAFFEWIQKRQLSIPVVLRFHYDCSLEDLIMEASMEYGALLCDGLGEGIWLEGPYSVEEKRILSFSILQAARMRMSKTDFISCPSCGRTLFDLQDVTKRIQSRTSHLPGVKIAIMGCIVNGPGEMADADFGYVGSKPGKIDLYVGKKCVEKDIDFSVADDRLIELIKAHGQWVEPINLI